jgi:hypothetical protein
LDIVHKITGDDDLAVRLEREGPGHLVVGQPGLHVTARTERPVRRPIRIEAGEADPAAVRRCRVIAGHNDTVIGLDGDGDDIAAVLQGGDAHRAVVAEGSVRVAVLIQA